MSIVCGRGWVARPLDHSIPARLPCVEPSPTAGSAHPTRTGRGASRSVPLAIAGRRTEASVSPDRRSARAADRQWRISVGLAAACRARARGFAGGESHLGPRGHHIAGNERAGRSACRYRHFRDIAAGGRRIARAAMRVRARSNCSPRASSSKARSPRWRRRLQHGKMRTPCARASSASRRASTTSRRANPKTAISTCASRRRPATARWSSLSKGCGTSAPSCGDACSSTSIRPILPCEPFAITRPSSLRSRRAIRTAARAAMHRHLARVAREFQRGVDNTAQPGRAGRELRTASTAAGKRKAARG